MGLDEVSRSDKEATEALKFGRGGGASRIKVFNSVTFPFCRD